MKRWNGLIKKTLGLKPFKNFEEMPTWLLVLLGGFCFLSAAEFGLILGPSALAFRDAFNKAGYIPFQGWLWLVTLLGLAVLFWVTGSAALRCSETLRNRYMP